MAAAVGLSAAMPAALPLAGHAGQVGFRAVRHWVPTTLPPGFTDGGVVAGNTTLYPDSGDRLLYAVSEGSWLAAYNLDTLAPDGQGLSVDPLTVAVPDRRGGRLIAAAMPGSGVPTLESFTVSGGGVAHTTPVTLAQLAGQWIVGLYQSDDGATLYALTAQYARQGIQRWVPDSVVVAKLDISNLAGGQASLVWSVPVPSCETPVGYTNQEGMASLVPTAGVGYAPVDHSLYFGCAGLAVQNAQRPPLPSGAGRLPLPTDGSAPSASSLQIATRPGRFAHGDAFYDPVSQRLLMTQGDTNSSAVVYDAPTHGYVGDIDTGPLPLSGEVLNVATGQFYGMSAWGPTGLLASFMRTTPVAQAYSFPQFTPKNTSPGLLALDPTTGYLLGPELVSTTTGRSDFYVLQYEGGTYVTPPAANPDNNTSNLAEALGLTGRTFSGSVQGYGALERWVGGVDATVQDATSVDLGSSSPVGAGTRELRLGYLNNLTLGVGEATASSVAADRDPGNTARDTASGCSLFGPLSTVSVPSPAPAPGQATGPCGWPYQPAQCISFDQQQQDNQSNSGGEAASTCDGQNELASTKASYHGDDSLGVQTHEASVVAKVSLDPVLGLVSTITSTAKGIDALGGALQIGQVVTIATSRAHGRPGTAGGQFTVHVSNVTMQGSPLCADQCDTHTLAAEINSQFNGLLSVDFPAPDPQLQPGSPGGYQAIIRRAPGAQVQEQVLNDQPADRAEVPGMVITLYLGDNEKPARLISYLAGAETESRYGIYALSPQAGADQGGGAGGGALGSGGAGALQASLGGLPGQLPAGSAGNGAATSVSQSPLAQLLPPGGWRWVVEHPLQALKLLFVWLVLLSPVYVAARRWLLLQRNRVLQEAAV